MIDKKNKLYLVLTSLFITFLLVAELTGSKLFKFAGFTMTIGVIPFPVTFLITDTLNEFYGKDGVRRTTLIGFAMILIAYFVIAIDLQIPAIPESPIDDATFEKVFVNAKWIIIGSITAYLIGQFIDIYVFQFLKKISKGKYIWLRATGSTVVSQLVDSFVVIFIAFWNLFPTAKLLEISTTNYIYKLCIAILLTPVIYLVHYWIESYLEIHAENISA
ncbi:MAG: queuosine precursor transporter [Leptospiraceae bacterium]|nr:queuosine precursor transporter [Leptospiraceae bacterium]